VERESILSSQPAAVMAIFDPERVPQGAEDRLRVLYQLTHAEAQVATEIGKGASIDQVADALAVQPSTVRTHLHHVFAKAGIRRQADLVRLVELACLVREAECRSV
jgi:DNA-binding CsgD family transcriptional regulator